MARHTRHGIPEELDMTHLRRGIQEARLLHPEWPAAELPAVELRPVVRGEAPRT